MNLVGTLLDIYYQKLNGNIPGFNIYKLTIPEGEIGNYILITPESGRDENNKSKRIETVIIRIDIVTNFRNDANQNNLEAADLQVKNIIYTSNLSGYGLEIRNVQRESYQYFIDLGQADMIYRKSSKYSQRVIEL